jgi:hypothetical protein
LPGYSNAVIYARNLTTGRTFQVSGTGGEADNPAVSGATVAWNDWKDTGNTFAKDLTTGRLFRVSRIAGLTAPAINGQTVAWLDRRGGAWHIDGTDLRTGRTYSVAVHAALGDSLGALLISGHTAVWTNWRFNPSVSIDGEDLVTGLRFRVATIRAGSFNPQFGPAKGISGHVVVWEGPGTIVAARPSYAIDGKDLVSGFQFRLARHGQAPAASGHTVVWLEPHGTTSDIVGAVLG